MAQTQHTSTWLIRMNGFPLMTIEAPSHMNPCQMAREVLLHGEPAYDDVTVTWHNQYECPGVKEG